MSTGSRSVPSHDRDERVGRKSSATPRDLGPDMRQALCTIPVIFALNYPALAQQQPVGVAEAESKPIARAGDFVGRSRRSVGWRFGRGSPAIVRSTSATHMLLLPSRASRFSLDAALEPLGVSDGH